MTPEERESAEWLLGAAAIGGIGLLICFIGWLRSAWAYYGPLEFLKTVGRVLAGVLIAVVFILLFAACLGAIVGIIIWVPQLVGSVILSWFH